jgi:hypothetical protein
MPQIETWPRLPVALREHLVERMHDRNITLFQPTIAMSVCLKSAPLASMASPEDLAKA